MADGGKVATYAGAGALAGAFGISQMTPEQGLAILQWLNDSIGPVGFVALITLGGGMCVSIAGNWLMWKRLKEKDEECRAEIQHMREAWKSVVDQKEADNKEGIENVAKLIRQVTILTERAAPVRTRSD